MRINKKILILLTLLLSTVISSIFADYTFKDANMYIVPIGSSGINLMSKWYPSRKDEKITAAALNGLGDGNKGWAGTTFPTDTTSTPNPLKFYDQNILVSGGYADGLTSSIDAEAFRTALNDGAYWRFSVTTDTGSLEMVSQSNTAYRRPFELSMLVTQMDKQYNGVQTRVDLVKLDSTNNVFNSAPCNLGTTTQESGSAFFFDLILALPGEFIPSTTVLTYEGKTYLLSELDDYAAMVTIHASLHSKDGTLLVQKTLTVPFTGYINLDTSYSDTTNVSLVVSPEAVSSVIDLRRQAGSDFRLASIDFMANYGDTRGTNHKPVDNIEIFFSSSSNPQTPGSNFAFVRNGATVATTRNSLGFTLRLEGLDGSSATFYGDEFIETTTSGGQATYTLKRQNGAAEYVTATSTTSPVLHSYYTIETHPDNFGLKEYRFFTYQGDIYMQLDSPPMTMEKGLYTEDVYIHVISDLL